MSFLGDAGGIYGSVMVLGEIVHSLISVNEQSAFMLKDYFRIEENPKSNASES